MARSQHFNFVKLAVGQVGGFKTGFIDCPEQSKTLLTFIFIYFSA
jgi:hypothetical protein